MRDSSSGQSYNKEWLDGKVLEDLTSMGGVFRQAPKDAEKQLPSERIREIANDRHAKNRDADLPELMIGAILEYLDEREE